MLLFSQLIEVADMKYKTILLVVALLFWAQFQFGLIGALFLFLVAGVIPGTALFVPPMVMFALLALVALLIIRWTKQQELTKQVREATARARDNSPVKKITVVSPDSNQSPIRRRFTHLQA